MIVDYIKTKITILYCFIGQLYAYDTEKQNNLKYQETCMKNESIQLSAIPNFFEFGF